MADDVGVVERKRLPEIGPAGKNGLFPFGDFGEQLYHLHFVDGTGLGLEDRFTHVDAQKEARHDQRDIFVGRRVHGAGFARSSKGEEKHDGVMKQDQAPAAPQTGRSKSLTNILSPN